MIQYELDVLIQSGNSTGTRNARTAQLSKHGGRVEDCIVAKCWNGSPKINGNPVVVIYCRKGVVFRCSVYNSSRMVKMTKSQKIQDLENILQLDKVWWIESSCCQVEGSIWTETWGKMRSTRKLVGLAGQPKEHKAGLQSVVIWKRGGWVFRKIKCWRCLISSPYKVKEVSSYRGQRWDLTFWILGPLRSKGSTLLLRIAVI